MSGGAGPVAVLEDGAELRAALEAALGAHFGAACRITRLDRRRADFATSFPLEELHLVLEDGRALDLIVKDVSPDALMAGARAAKPRFLLDPRREIAAYRQVLAGAGVETATCYGASTDEARGRYWLFLEAVPGVELYQVGDLESWKEVARWLAAAQGRFADHLRRGGSTAHLLRYDDRYYWMWPARAWSFAPKSARPHLYRIIVRYDAVVQHLLALPRTVVHGEFYASNVLVQTTAGGLRVCPIDWEMAGVGAGLIDLAALTAGSWTDEQRKEMALAYHAALAPTDGWPPRPESLLEALDACRLHLAMQWLGWSPTWRPPREHEQDWLGEALRLAGRMGL